jgi:signal peptidase I
VERGRANDAADEEALVASSSTDPDAPATEGDGRSSSAAARRRPLGCLIEIAETLLLTIVIFWVIQTFVAQPFQVQQESMHGTLEEGQYVLIDKLTPRFDAYSRGDIVVFNPGTHDGACYSPPEDPPGPEDTPFIKRVIGEPGDTVAIRDGEVYVNDVLLDEPYIHGVDTDAQGEGETWTVPSDRLFVMGDNRPHSSDSRAFGPICTLQIVGRAWLRYWPLNTFGILQTPAYPNVPASAHTSPR